MFERQQQKQVQDGGGHHPEGHNLAEESGEGSANRDVRFEGLAMKGGMSEGGDVELAATHQTEDHDRQYLKRHTAFDVLRRPQSHKLVTRAGMHQKCHVLHAKIIAHLHNFR
jgi:hypothetical protein